MMPMLVHTAYRLPFLMQIHMHIRTFHANVHAQYMQTYYRLYQTRHHRLVTKMATMNSLQNALNNVPGKIQHERNLMGDCYSRQVAKKILSSVAEDHDEALLDLQAGVESLWLGDMTGAPLRSRRAMAKRMGVNGFTLNPDNVGIVSIEPPIPKQA